MKKILLSAGVALFVIALSGCMKASPDNSSSSLPEESVEKTNAGNSQGSIQSLMQESLRIQNDKSMTKEEKATALEDVQRRIRQVSDKGAEKN
ncbi:hypothetical protein BMS3Abin15_01053 [bacterium BMS3Abin15]|nr:hypothetical protein BMS3Abin15_01053 [bacterium BMS3Abin15]HDH07805.1 hypothetical protein [Candidatus Moranbacteria bacterium]HDZ86049.1 hypothetical protein [Candidatus Moranbacteria bacterium]